jgi:hypothetical protein
MAQLTNTNNLNEVLTSLQGMVGLNQKVSGVVVTPTSSDIAIPMGMYDGSVGSGKVSGATSIKSTQRGTYVFSTTEVTKDIAITVIDTSKSIILVTSNNPNGTVNTYVQSYSASGEILNAITIRLERGGIAESTTTRVNWQVIEFNNVKSLQRGITSSPTSQPITMVDVSKSMFIYSTSSENTGTLYYYLACDSWLVDSTHICTNQKGNSCKVKWQLIEFN